MSIPLTTQGPPIAVTIWKEEKGDERVEAIEEILRLLYRSGKKGGRQDKIDTGKETEATPFNLTSLFSPTQLNPSH